MTSTPDPRDDQTDGKLLGAALRAVRRRRGLTAKQVANSMNMPLRTLARRPGHTRRPRRCCGAKM